jgi:hypothetical protein
MGELLSYQIRRTLEGNYKYNAPEGQHDDTVIAAALGWKAAIQYT